MADHVVINPLGEALRHYGEALTGNLGEAGERVEVISMKEPAARGGGTLNRLRWIRAWAGAIRSTRRAPRDAVVISVWPVLGYWDCLALSFAGGAKRALIVHDPEPLVRAVGYGRAARFAARRMARRVELIAHGDEAIEAMERQGLHRVTMVSHPMLKPRPATGGTDDGKVRIRVLGQFKDSRNTEALESIARERKPSWELEMVGRGWPAVDGWSTRPEFVPEREFEELIRTADVLVIPYEKFFQSGVAVRALETNTPVVGPAVSSLTGLLGSGTGWLVEGQGWAAAVAVAVETPAERVSAIAEGAYERAVADWRRWTEA